MRPPTVSKILVTGASGFIGSALVPALRTTGYLVRPAFRSLAPEMDAVTVGEIGPATDWKRALKGVDAVVHLAGVAHAKKPDHEYRRVIVEGTRVLAQAASNAGVQRFVFVSSIKAAAGASDRRISERDTPQPVDPYGRAKLEAEAIVLGYPRMGPVVLRPPLVHAPRAQANFERLLWLANSAAPLPFASLTNRRNLISLTSLVAAIQAVIATDDLKAGVFHVCDQPAVTSRELVTLLRQGLGKSPNLFPAPKMLVGLAGRALTQSLEIDDTAFRAHYGYGAFTNIDARDLIVNTARTWKEGA